jgi:DNA replication protein DnaC
MEKLGDILKKTLEGIPKENTGTWSIGNIELPENDLAENPCPICHGAGFVHPLLDSGKTDYKRVVPCECTSERIKQESHDKLQKFSNLGSLTRLTFEKLLPDGRVINGLKIPGFKKAYEAAMEYAHNPEGWLILIGPNGCGKTHLASAIANYQLSITKSIFYIELANLLDHLRATYKLNSEIEYDELFEQLKNTPLLILDDVSISNRTLWAKEKIQQLMNHRYNERIPTVITSSHSVSELEKNLDCHFMDT